MTLYESLPDDIKDRLYDYCNDNECLNDAMLRALRAELGIFYREGMIDYCDYNDNKYSHDCLRCDSYKKEINELREIKECYGNNLIVGWHNLEKNPDDLPKENMIDVFAIMKLDNEQLMPVVANYSHYTKKWYPDYDDEEIINVVKWHEIPKFKE